jgi:acyl-coenzyme A synthetase/AMP-(fatty) acid ligase
MVGGRTLAQTMGLIGGTAVLRDTNRGADAFMNEVNERHCTFTYFIPTWLRAAMREHRREGLLYPGLRRLMSCADFLRPHERNLVLSRVCREVVDVYSTSEAGIATMSRNQDQLRYDGSVGKRLSDSRVEIVDTNDEPVPAGTVGEVRYRSPTTPSEYHRNPELTARKLRGGWFYPGDRGVLNSDGYLFLKGRSDGAIQFMGQLIHPTEIEAVACQLQEVDEAVAIGLNLGGEGRIALFVVGDTQISRESVLRHLREQLAGYKLPVMIEPRRDVPRTPTGKPARVELRQYAERVLAARVAQGAGNTRR